MTPDTPQTPPALHNQPAATSDPVAVPPTALPAEPVPETAEKVDWRGRLVAHKWKFLLGLVVIVLGGLLGYAYLLTSQQDQAAPVSAVTGGLNQLTTAPTPPDAVSPIDGMEQSLNRDREHKTELDPDTIMTHAQVAPEPVPVTPSPAAEAPVTAEQRENYRRQMTFAARANNTDSITTTTRDPRTGQYVQRRVATQRIPLSTGSSSAPRRQRWQGYSNDSRPARPLNTGFNAVTPQNQQTYLAAASSAPAAAPRPTHDTDGTPFETNDEINLMLQGLPVAVQQQFEKMSGHRYRPLPSSVQQQSRDRRTEMAYVPGMDGFNTIRFRGSNAQAEEETPLPDIFYRCSVQGDQRIRTGSVVTLRLAEDATFDGLTFPRNMIFSAIASVESNRVSLTIDRLGQYKMKVQTYNYAYMPGIMIDPGKRAPTNTGMSMGSTLQQSSVSELSNAIAQSQQAANSWQGIAGRMGVTLLGRLPRAGEKLREVLLPDGYPLLVTKQRESGRSDQQQAGVNTPGGLMGQGGNPFQSLMMSGQGVGGYQGNTGVVPPLYYPAPATKTGQ